MRAGEAYLGIKCVEFESRIFFSHMVWLLRDIYINGAFLGYVSDN